MLKEPEQKPPSRWNWVLWWRVDRDEVDWQAAHYSELGFFQAFKGWSVLGLLVSAALTTLITLGSGAGLQNLVDVGVLVVLAGFIYLGHRWAMIGAMLWWTLEKLIQIAANPGAIVFAVLWWGLYLHAFYMAFLVERQRRQPRVDPDVFA